ncbi:hypothetical protein MGH68_14380 [Erysipelothrix sp. D19-032]
MFKIAIVDDNPLFRDQVFQLISESSDSLNIATIDTYESSRPILIDHLSLFIT